MKVLTQKNIMNVPRIYAYKIVCIDDRFSKSTIIYRGEHAAYEFIKAVLKEYKYCRKIMKKHFNKNLVMTEEEEHLFQQRSNCWICNLLRMMMKRLEIIVTLLVNSEEQDIGIVT